MYLPSYQISNVSPISAYGRSITPFAIYEAGHTGGSILLGIPLAYGHKIKHPKKDPNSSPIAILLVVGRNSTEVTTGELT